jgi:uncharacterized protein (TIGR03118 family)
MSYLPLRYLWCCALSISPLVAQQDRYVQTNLVSDVIGLAAHTDPNLVNAWGIAASATSPWWVNSAGKGLSILYDGTGTPFPINSPLKVAIPPLGSSIPTGIVFNNTTDFPVDTGLPAAFLFSTINGTIAGWNPNVLPATAVTKVTTPGAVYTGLTLGQINGANVLYAANFAGGKVDVFDRNFMPLSLPSGAFQDPTVPAGFSPFNVQNVGGSIFVMFAQPIPGGEVKGPGLGFVDKFSSSGVLQLRLQHGDWMNAPWGVTMAPASGFGVMSGRLLVGQFGGGQIASFDAQTGQFLGLMLATNGSPVHIDGLWGIRFGNGGTAGSATELFFAAGINDEADGLFGKLSVNPQIVLPPSITLAPGQTISLPLTLSSPAPTDLMISLTTSNPTVATVTPTEFITAGSTGQDRRGPTVTGVSFGTAVITASAPGFASATINVQVTLNMSFAPSSLTETVGTQARALLLLSSPAPVGGLTVNLSSSNLGVAMVPTTVFIGAGSTSASVPVTPVGRGSAIVTASVSPFVTVATLNVTVQ